MNPLSAVRDWCQEAAAGWDRFWFTPADPATLCLIRVLAGTMLFYTHLVWTLGLEDFFGPNGWIPLEAVEAADRPGSYAWSWLLHIESTGMLWTAHLAALAALAMFALGLFTRVTAVLAFLITVAYVHRAPGALFGLDHINVMLATYLMIGPSGARYSLDNWLRRRRAARGDAAPSAAASSTATSSAASSMSSAMSPAPAVTANIAIRLIQLHMCVVYLFSGISKLLGMSWWTGTAVWDSIANYEYQSIDMTWLAGWPMLVAAMTHVTVFWETFYCALVWPRLTRPITLAFAVPVHLGIALFLGMPTFGLVMLLGNLAFVPPWLVRTVVEWRPGRAAGETTGAGEAARGGGAP